MDGLFGRFGDLNVGCIFNGFLGRRFCDVNCALNSLFNNRGVRDFGSSLFRFYRHSGDGFRNGFCCSFNCRCDLLCRAFQNLLYRIDLLGQGLCYCGFCVLWQGGSCGVLYRFRGFDNLGRNISLRGFNAFFCRFIYSLSADARDSVVLAFSGLRDLFDRFFCHCNGNRCLDLTRCNNHLLFGIDKYIPINAA